MVISKKCYPQNMKAAEHSADLITNGNTLSQGGKRGQSFNTCAAFVLLLSLGFKFGIISKKTLTMQAY
jgi:hypothetical protein